MPPRRLTVSFTVLGGTSNPPRLNAVRKKKSVSTSARRTQLQLSWNYYARSSSLSSGRNTLTGCVEWSSIFPKAHLDRGTIDPHSGPCSTHWEVEA